MKEYPILQERERLSALEAAITIIQGNLPTFTYQMQNHSSVNNVYPPVPNNQWTSGFWPGSVWLAYEATKNPIFLHAAQIMVESFYDRIKNKVEVDHHDMGFLYTPTCVKSYLLTANERAKEAAIMAADQLLTRYQEKGSFFQAWGALGAKDNYRTLALTHTETTLTYSFREDFSSYHTYFMDPETGEGGAGRDRPRLRCKLIVGTRSSVGDLRPCVKLPPHPQALLSRPF